jgi:hypothetical protein
MAQQVLESAQAAVDSVRRPRQVNSVSLIDEGAPGGRLIQLNPQLEPPRGVADATGGQISTAPRHVSSGWAIAAPIAS